MAKRHYGNDSVLERNRAGRWAVLLGSFGLVLLVPTLFGSAVGAALSFTGSTFLFKGLGFAGGVWAIGKIFPLFWVIVPQTAAFVTTNQFPIAGKDPNVPYGPGGHPRYPWELVEESGNISLDVFTVPVHEEVPTADTKVLVDVTVQFRFDLEHISTVVGLDRATIEEGFIAQINEWFSDRLSRMSGDDAKNAVKSLRKELETEFKQTRRDDLIQAYGLIVESLQIKSIDFPPRVQEVRDTVEEALRIGNNLWRLLGFDSLEAFNEARTSGKLSEVDIARARDDFLAASGNLTKSVHKVDVTGVDPATVKLFAGAIQGASQVLKGGKK